MATDVEEKSLKLAYVCVCLLLLLVFRFYLIDACVSKKQLFVITSCSDVLI